ncbi:N-acetylglucosaminyl-diphospho-decaprenol L-rhamnosyltransferase [mine drainage metagenome]|uniref:N-acetylglucosaminyl-diphospho-decaprenol L-rhamnosyltransferase n=1 Tax=mine drainage metagenome TaxID=410659 RepID=A0A1J5RAS6_9ZZZZ
MTPPIIGLVLEYRKPEFTQQCVRSLLRERCSAVVVWDNSDDGGYSLDCLRRTFGSDPRVLLLAASRNLGFAGGVRHGMEAIAVAYPQAWVLLINNDARLLPGAVLALRQALLACPGAVLASPRVRHGGRIVGPLYYHRRLALVFTRPVRGAFAYASGSVMLVAPSRLGSRLLDEAFFMYGEDVELGWRLRQSGAIVHLPLLLAEHLGSQGSGMGSLRYETWLVRSHWLLARKLTRCAGDVALNYLGRAVSLPARALLRCLRYRSLTPIRGFIAGTFGAFCEPQRARDERA